MANHARMRRILYNHLSFRLFLANPQPETHVTGDGAVNPTDEGSLCLAEDGAPARRVCIFLLF
jgi:hypothetical protein